MVQIRKRSMDLPTLQLSLDSLSSLLCRNVALQRNASIDCFDRSEIHSWIETDELLQRALNNKPMQMLLIGIF